MRYVAMIVLASGLAAQGCSGSNERSAAGPGASAQAFDYLGRLDGAVPGQLSAAFVKLAVCDGIADGEASCIQSVTLDGFPAGAADLKPGQIVEIHGTRHNPAIVSDSAAVGIDIQRAVVGPVEAIDANHWQLTVLGQQVYANGLSAAGAANVEIGDIVTVYGHVSAAGDVLAELIEPYAGDPLWLLRGVLTEPGAGRIAIGGLAVDLASAAREGFPGGAPLPGDFVLVLADEPPAAGVLTAATVRCLGECAASNWRSGSVRGFMTAWRSPTDFDVGGVAIRPTSCDCVYVTPAIVGSFMDVYLDDGRAWLGTAPSTPSRTQLAGTIEAIDSALREIEMLGFHVQASPATQVWDFGTYSLLFEDLQVGDPVYVLGAAVGDAIVAGSIDRDTSASARITSYDYTLDRPAIGIAGRTVLTDDSTTVRTCYSHYGPEYWSLDELFGSPSSGGALVLSLESASTPLVAREVTVCASVGW